jgi:hypothetical protein
MDLHTRKAIAIIIVGVFAGLAVFLYMKPGSPPEEDGLQKLNREFMSCLPSETSDASRDEIRGILDRFHDRAIMDRVNPVDRLEIENEMIGYVAAGKILKDELFAFMSKVGEATRRHDAEHPYGVD